MNWKKEWNKFKKIFNVRSNHIFVYVWIYVPYIDMYFSWSACIFLLYEYFKRNILLEIFLKIALMGKKMNSFANIMKYLFTKHIICWKMCAITSILWDFSMSWKYVSRRKWNRRCFIIKKIFLSTGFKLYWIKKEQLTSSSSHWSCVRTQHYFLHW